MSADSFRDFVLEQLAALDGREEFVGLKFLSDYHRYPITGDRYTPAYEFAQARSLPILMHTWGGSAFDGYDAVREVAERYPEARIICGHSIHGEVFTATEFDGTPAETDEAVPVWFPVDDLPYHNMWADDPVWYPKRTMNDSTALMRCSWKLKIAKNP